MKAIIAINIFPLNIINIIDKKFLEKFGKKFLKIINYDWKELIDLLNSNFITSLLNIIRTFKKLIWCSLYYLLKIIAK